MNNFCPVRILVLSFVLLSFLLVVPPFCVGQEEIVDLHQQQAREKQDLNEMKSEIEDIKSTLTESFQSVGMVESTLNRKNVKEFHLVVKDGTWELVTGTSIQALTYNGRTPGPLIRVQEADLVRIILHNQLKVATSFHIHGPILPQKVDGLPRKGQGLVDPGETYAFQFVANKPGTYWYHPQIIHLDQQLRGLYGGLIVEPKEMPKSYEKEIVAVLGQYQVACLAGDSVSKVTRSSKSALPSSSNPAAKSTWETVAMIPSRVASPTRTYFTVNGKCAPSIPPIEVQKGERVRLRIINATQETCPLHLTGHKLAVTSINGADGLEPHISRDSIALAPADRLDLEFSADNPGVWSLSSLIFSQCTNNGKFPGGMACVVRYPESMGDK